MLCVPEFETATSTSTGSPAPSVQDSIEHSIRGWPSLAANTKYCGRARPTELGFAFTTSGIDS